MQNNNAYMMKTSSA